MNTELLDALRRRTASASIGASTARKMGHKGTIAVARNYLATLELADFDCETELEFQAVLDRATDGFVEKIEHWGAARKFINIFLLNVIYNRFLNDKYILAHTCAWLELPLDSHVAGGLREEPEGISLKSWKTVIGLTQPESREYQDVAAKVAKRIGCERIHLDLLYWRRDTEKAPQRRVKPF